MDRVARVVLVAFAAYRIGTRRFDGLGPKTHDVYARLDRKGASFASEPKFGGPKLVMTTNGTGA